MSGSKFNISAAIRSAYIFAGQERAYLARLSLLPLGVALVTNYLVITRYNTVSPFIVFLMNLPATVLCGWYMFMEARLLLLGERFGTQADGPAPAAERQRAMQLSILIWLLFNMWGTAFVGYQSWAVENNRANQNSGVMVLWLFLFGAAIWSIRFMVAHLLAAVDYPIRQYIYQVNGIGISFRLFALYFICLMPVLVAFMMIVAVVFPQPGEAISEGMLAARIVLETLGYFIGMVLTTAAACFALKEMLGRNPREKAA